jgi:general secretion pathway protein A
MYCDFFGLTEKPFTITPNPHFIFLSSNHKEAFAHLVYGIESHAGFISLTGEVGTGKTTLLRTLLSNLDKEQHRSALIFNPCQTGEQLMAAICQEFGLKTRKKDINSYYNKLNKFLISQHQEGRNVVLVIDEAQNLPVEVLEQLRMISNLETEQDKLIQIVLAGQPELDDILGRHDLRQLSQRIMVRYRLKPMGQQDTVDYINHRLRVSGNRTPDLFSAGALKRIFLFSKGTPRLINVACEHALVMAWSQENSTVTSAMAEKVIAVIQPGYMNTGGFKRLFTRMFCRR